MATLAQSPPSPQVPPVHPVYLPAPTCPVHNVKARIGQHGYYCSSKNADGSFCVKQWRPDATPKEDAKPKRKGLQVSPENTPNGDVLANLVAVVQDWGNACSEIRSEITSLKHLVLGLQEEGLEMRLAVQSLATHASIIAEHLKARVMALEGNEPAFWNEVEAGLRERPQEASPLESSQKPLKNPLLGEASQEEASKNSLEASREEKPQEASRGFSARNGNGHVLMNGGAR